MKALRQKIEEEIRQRGPLPFSRYMELCLYDGEFGYYSRNAAQFGKAGDFYTSSDIHAVFGRLLARQFDEMWRVLGCPAHIVLKELGPGRGLFAQDVLDWSEKKFPDFYRAWHYALVEMPRLHCGEPASPRLFEPPFRIRGRQRVLSAEAHIADVRIRIVFRLTNSSMPFPSRLSAAQGSLRVDREMEASRRDGSQRRQRNWNSSTGIRSIRRATSAAKFRSNLNFRCKWLRTWNPDLWLSLITATRAPSNSPDAIAER